MKKRSGFTLIEMLIVIAILGLLAAVLVTQFGSGTESARQVKCKSNLRNLAQAAITYANENQTSTTLGFYPAAGSYEYDDMVDSSGDYVERYYEQKGWISWYSLDAYKNSPKQKRVNASFKISFYTEDEVRGMFAVTNGALWTYSGRQLSNYQCPTQLRTLKGAANKKVYWSYVMNARFGWDTSKYSDTIGLNYVGLTALSRPDKTLLFAEIPSSRISSSEMSGDCVLQYRKAQGVSDSDAEWIGFNHESNGHQVANVVFADAHVESLIAPSNADEDNLKDLAMWLCTGVDVTLSGGEYKEITSGL